MQIKERRWCEPSTLYLVATPIGNLADITYRAVEVLKEADILLAEDTRKARILLTHYGIRKTPHPYHKDNEHTMTPKVVSWLKEGSSIAYISEAGTPGISDPGFLLVRACVQEGIAVRYVPGASALVGALVVSGIACERFCFEGFLPRKKWRARLEQLRREERTIVFFEAPHRLTQTLLRLREYFGQDRRAAVVRELTKLHEEVVRGTLTELLERFRHQQPKGEITIVIEGNRGEHSCQQENNEA